ncbi:hypothetical protein HN841_03300 [archaeon]|nr:hypothetical protein [archaeon]
MKKGVIVLSIIFVLALSTPAHAYSIDDIWDDFIGFFDNLITGLAGGGPGFEGDCPCVDGTSPGHCSSSEEYGKPWLCETEYDPINDIDVCTFSQDCQSCGCPSGQECQGGGECTSPNGGGGGGGEDPVCGDGSINQDSEECDGSNFGEETCSSQGFLDGNLTCTDNCIIDTSTCTNCNNDGICDDKETCGGCVEDCLGKQADCNTNELCFDWDDYDGSGNSKCYPTCSDMAGACFRSTWSCMGNGLGNIQQYELIEGGAQDCPKGYYDCCRLVNICGDGYCEGSENCEKDCATNGTQNSQEDYLNLQDKIIEATKDITDQKEVKDIIEKKKLEVEYGLNIKEINLFNNINAVILGILPSKSQSFLLSKKFEKEQELTVSSEKRDGITSISYHETNHIQLSPGEIEPRRVAKLNIISTSTLPKILFNFAGF